MMSISRWVRAREGHLALHREADLVAVLVEDEPRGLAGLEGARVGRLVGQDQVREAGAIEALDALLRDEAAVGVELDGDAAALRVVDDRHEVGVEHGLAHLVELHRVERSQPRPLLRDLVEEAEDLLLLHEAPAALHDVVGAPGALEVAGVGDLDEEVVDRVEAAGQLAQLGQGGDGGQGGGVLGFGRQAHRDPADAQVAAELEPEGRPLVLGAAGVEALEGRRGSGGSGRGRRRRRSSAGARPCRGRPRAPGGRGRRTGAGTGRSGRRSTRPPRRDVSPARARSALGRTK